MIPMRILLRGALRDRISLGYAVVFPIVLLLVLGFVFTSPGYRQLLLGGTIALSILFFSTNGTAFEAFAQRSQGVYKLLRATPYRTVAFLGSLTAARGVVALLSALAVLIVGRVVFGVALVWSAVLLVPLLVVAIALFSFLGLVVANLAGNEGQINMLSNVLTLPLVFGSEAFYSLDHAPQWVRILNAVNPMGFLIRGIHAAFAGDAEGTLLPLAVLLAWAAGVLALAIVTFRWEPGGAGSGEMWQRRKAAA